MNEKNVCGSCGSPVHANDPGGICPSCLMGHAFQNDANNPTLDSTGSPCPRAEELVGRFPNLEILHLVGHGGMGAVYLARQTNLDRMVALKVLSPRLGSDPQFTERFTREARTLAKLSHPNIVTVFDYGLTDKINFLVMEYVEGINLRDAIQGGTLTAKESLAIVPQICDALQYAHNQGVIHRDIKPENILLDSQGRVKIADFGLAKLLQPDQDSFTLTGTQQVLGTRNYMAPEQIEHPDVVDHRADIYSLGVVFYELLTGELPIGRFAVPSEKAAVTHGLDDVVLRTLEKEPARRFQQASEVRTAVESLGEMRAEPDPQPNVPKQKTIMALPFSIKQVYHGLAAAHGIAHLYPDRIELEYELIDDVLGTVKSSTKLIQVPLGKLINVKFVKGFFSDHIEFQTDRIEGAKGVPNALQGRFTLGTKRSDLELASEFVVQVDRLRHHGNMPDQTPEYRPEYRQTPQTDYRQPVPPRKSKVAGTGAPASLTREEVIESLKVPRIGFLIVGVIHMIMAVKGLLSVRAWQKIELLSFDLFPGVEFQFFLPSFNWASVQTFITLAIAILLLSIASRLQRPRQFGFVIVALVISLLAPVQVAYIFVLVFAVWTLVVLSDGRCKDVFLDGDHQNPLGYRRASGFFRTLLIAAGLGLGFLCVAGLLFAFLWVNGRSNQTTPVRSPGSTEAVESIETPKVIPAPGVATSPEIRAESKKDAVKSKEEAKED